MSISSIVLFLVVIGSILFIITMIRIKKNAGSLSEIYAKYGISFGVNDVWNIIEFSGTRIKSTSLNITADIESIKMPVTFETLKAKMATRFVKSVEILEQSESINEVNHLQWNIIKLKLKIRDNETKKDSFSTRIYAYLFLQEHCIEAGFSFNEDHQIQKMENIYDVLLGCFKKV